MMAKPPLGSGSKQELVSPCPSLWVRVLARRVVTDCCPLPAAGDFLLQDLRFHGREKPFFRKGNPPGVP